MTNININEIRKEILANGLMSEDLIIDCKEKAIYIDSEWDMEDDIIINSVKIGVYSKDIFFKGVEKSIELPKIVKDEDYEITESNFKKNMEAMYPDFLIILKVI